MAALVARACPGPRQTPRSAGGRGPTCGNLRRSGARSPGKLASSVRMESRMAQAAPLVPTATDFALPPVLNNARGGSRTVGVEIEFVGPDRRGGRAGADGALGGAARRGGPACLHASRARRSATSASNSTAASCTRKSRADLLGGVLPQVAAWFGSAARYLVPCELVTAPIPDRPAARGRPLVEILRGVGAKGTQDAPLYAFGLHFNPEIPAPGRRDRRPPS